MTTGKKIIALSDRKAESQPSLAPLHCSASNEFADPSVFITFHVVEEEKKCLSGTAEERKLLAMIL